VWVRSKPAAPRRIEGGVGVPPSKYRSIRTTGRLIPAVKKASSTEWAGKIQKGLQFAVKARWRRKK
jgi:hypothetical protein